MTTNPFLPTEAPPPPREVDIPDSVLGSTELLNGPASPALAPSPAGDVKTWQLTEHPADSGLVVMGLHGGSGASTVAALLATADRSLDDLWPSTDGGLGWPVASGWARPRPPLNVVAVYRPHRAGIEAATEFARTWAADALPDSHLLGIIAVDDGPNLLQAQKQAVKRIGMMTPHGWHLPWIEQWRIAPPDFETLPRRVRKTVRSIRKVMDQEGVQL